MENGIVRTLAGLSLMIITFSAFPQTTSPTIALQEGEKLLNVANSTNGYVAVIEKTISGSIVPKKEQWIATADGRIGPFAEVLSTVAINGSNWQNYSAIVRVADGLFFAMGAPLSGSTLPTMLKFRDDSVLNPFSKKVLGNGNYLIVSPDASHFAAIVKSKSKDGAFDVVTESGLFGTFAFPILVGFVDSSPVYWSIENAPNKQYKCNLFKGKDYVYSLNVTDYEMNVGIGNVSFKDFGYDDPIYISPDGKQWGYFAETSVPVTKGLVTVNEITSTLFAFTVAGQKKIAGPIKSQILAITKSGEIVWEKGSIYVDASDSGIKLNGASNDSFFISPDQSRIAMMTTDGFIIDGNPVPAIPKLSTGTNYHVDFSPDSKHYQVTLMSGISKLKYWVDGVSAPKEIDLTKDIAQQLAPPKQMYPTIVAVMQAGSDGCFLVTSTDGGATWSLIKKDMPPPNGSNCYAVTGQRVYVGNDRDGSIYMTSIDDSTWRDLGGRFPVNEIVCSDSTVVAIDRSGMGANIYQGSGKGWTLVRLPREINHDPNLIHGPLFCIAGPYLVVGDGKKRIALTDNFGKSWKWYNIDSGLKSNAITALASNGSTIYVGTDKGIAISSDAGKTWGKVTSRTGLAADSVKYLFVAGQVVYVGTDGWLSISNNGGATWKAHELPVGMHDDVVRIYAKAADIYLSNGNILFISRDGGATWSKDIISGRLEVILEK
jgi:photosystem II stability/assembly factor-like uncharacterized protein